MASYKHVVLGGGIVAGHFAKEYIENGGKGSDLAILSTDNALPYERPPLSKSFLAGKDTEEAVLINKADFYRSNGIEIRLETPVSTVDVASKLLKTRAGDTFGFEKIVISTGAEVKTLDTPGASSGNVMYLRSLGDSKLIRDRAASAKSAVVLGGGFIAMEVASVLAQASVETTLVVRDERIWKAFFTPEMSAFFENYYIQKGVKLSKQTGLVEISNSNVRLSNSQTVACDLVVAGIGVRPVTRLAEQAGLAVDNGVVVNEFLETDHGHISAAGDVANYPDTLFDNKRRRVEHWDNAVSQGQHIARSFLGRRESFVHVPYFFSDVFDLSYEFWGDTEESDRIVHRGDLRSSSFSVWWLKKNRLIAAFTMNRPDEEREFAPEIIRSKQLVSAERIRDSTSILDAKR